MPYFGIFAEITTHHPPFTFHREPRGAFPGQSPFRYRLNSRLLVAQICESMEMEGGSVVHGVAKGCGDHFYTMNEDGLTLVYRETRSR
jgi:hypothetical protein